MSRDAIQSALETTLQLLIRAPKDTTVESVGKQLTAMLKDPELDPKRITIGRLLAYEMTPAPTKELGIWVDQCYAALLEFKRRSKHKKDKP